MNLLVISGGRHPYEESTPVLEGFLTGAGHEVNVTEDASILADADAMSGYDALVFNTMRAGDDAMTREQQAGMTQFINDGKGFVCIHIAGCASEDWYEYYDITGGGWLLTDSLPPALWQVRGEHHGRGQPRRGGCIRLRDERRTLHGHRVQRRQRCLHDRRFRRRHLDVARRRDFHARRHIPARLDAAVRQR